VHLLVRELYVYQIARCNIKKILVSVLYGSVISLSSFDNVHPFSVKNRAYCLLGLYDTVPNYSRLVY